MNKVNRLILFFLALTLLTGLIYPLLITGIAQVFFPGKSNGSLIYTNDTSIGSELIGQTFDSSIYFSSRPSAISYNPLPSSGSNYGGTNEKLNQLVKERKEEFVLKNKLSDPEKVPAEMVFASSSGLDPHISKPAALLQVDRIAEARGLDEAGKARILSVIDSLTLKPRFLILGEERINVLLLNLEINKIN
jgi:K+-transporting ATPase ATPase C chain